MFKAAHVVRMSLFSAFLAAASVAQAASWVTWLGGEGKWSDGSQWDRPSYGRTGNHVNFPNGGIIELDGDYVNYEFHVSSSVVFCGDGLNQCGNTGFSNATIRVTDSAQVKLTNLAQPPLYSTNVTLIVEKNAFMSMSDLANGLTNLTIRDNGVFEQYTRNAFKLAPNGVLEMSGGAYSSAYELKIPAGARLAISGGTMTVRKLTLEGEADLTGGALNATGSVVMTNARLKLHDRRIVMPISGTSVTASSIESFEVSGDGGIDIEITPTAPASGRYLVLYRKIGQSIEGLPVRLTGATDGWKLFKYANYVVIVKTVTPESVSTAGWYGFEDSFLSNPGNWKGTVPVCDGKAKLDLYCFDTPIVSNDIVNASYSRAKNLSGEAYNKCLPVLVRGKTLDLTSTLQRHGDSAAVSATYYPLLFECPVVSTQKLLNAYGSYSSGMPGVAFLGGVSSKRLDVVGWVYVGATSTCEQLVPLNEAHGPSHDLLTVLSNGTFTITAQNAAIERGCCVEKCGKMVVQGTAFAWKECTDGHAGNYHQIDGELDIEAPYLSFPVPQEYFGSGVVRMPAVMAEQTEASQPLRLSGALTVYQKGWVTTGHGAICRPIEVGSGSVTLGADADWSYGPDFTTYSDNTTTADERALRVADGATLTIDTYDGAASEARTVELRELAVGGGTLRKSGEGVLALAAADGANAVALVHDGGTLRIDAVQTFTTATFAAGSSLAVSSGILATLTTSWTTLIVADVVTGVPASADTNLAVRVITDAETGKCLVQMRRIPGLVIILR